MRKWCFLILTALMVNCGAMVLPDSAEPVLTDENLLSGFVRVDPDDKKPEKLETKAWLWQDGGDLVIRFEAEIDENFHKGAISMRDEAPSSDFMRVQLITIPDAHYAYYYAAYPLGNIVDGVRDSRMNVDYSWNSNYNYTSDIRDKIWQVTMRIPLNELRFKQELPYQWKIILTRYHHHKQEYFSFPYANTKDGKDYFLKAQDIELQSQVRHKLDFSLRPYFVKSYDLISRESSFDPEHVGLDIFFNPGQRTRIKIALNPDYSDIPMDSARDDYNQKDPPYYDENRFFFTEDLDVFGLDWNVFYSRNIVQPRVAAKGTGNLGNLNWGALAAWDKDIKIGDYLLNRGNYYQVLALNPGWKTFKFKNALVSRMNSGYYGHLYSGATRWEPIPRLSIGAGYNLSASKDEALGMTEPDIGYQTKLDLAYSPGDFAFSLDGGWLSKDLSYDAGYLTDKDLANLSASASWSKFYVDRKLRSLSFTSWGQLVWMELSEDTFLSKEAMLSANINIGDMFMSSYGAYALGPDLWDNLHEVYVAAVNFGWGNRKNLQFTGVYNVGTELVYALSDTYPKHTLGGSAMVKPFDNLSLWVSGTWNHKGYRRQTVEVFPGYFTLLDNQYIVANAGLDFTPAPSFKISMGSGLSTYEKLESSAELSYFGNLRYEFKPDWFLYLGLKSAQTQEEASTWTAPLGELRKDLSTVYMKLSVTI